MNKKFIIIIMFFVYLLGVSINTWYQHEIAKDDLLKSIDRQLGWAASGTALILGNNYHNSKFLSNLDKENYFKIMNKISKFNDKMGTAYLSTFIQKDKKIVFAATSYKANEWSDEKYKDDFLVEYNTSSVLLKSTFYNNKISYEYSQDKWGKFRSILMPIKSEDGSIYVVAADIDISNIFDKLDTLLMNTIFQALYYLLLILPIAYLYSRSLKKDKELLELTVINRTDELNNTNERLGRISTRLSKYLSPQVKDMIVNDLDEMQLRTARKKLTIFFSDIKNFTNITEKMEPEEMSNILNNYFEEMNIIALKYNATIDKFIGDAILIFMGDPTTLGAKMDALNTVSMAIEMKNKMEKLRTKWFEMGIESPFRIRVGINTGYCTVGNFGSDSKMDYTILGSPVNLASRLESLAQIDEILISYETYALIRDKIACEEMDSIDVKGFNDKVKTYKVIGLKDGLDINKHISVNDTNYKLEIDIKNMDFKERAELKEKLIQVNELL
ncbi:MAG: adenylate/guanylate cyclase domain-containing protein [Sulfurovum sp.]